MARVTAPATEGRANSELVEALAEAFAVPRSAVRIVAGTRSKTKVVEIAGATSAVVERLLSEA